jgi:hypothetical protein
MLGLLSLARILSSRVTTGKPSGRAPAAITLPESPALRIALRLAVGQPPRDHLGATGLAREALTAPFMDV